MLRMWLHQLEMGDLVSLPVCLSTSLSVSVLISNLSFGIEQFYKHFSPRTFINSSTTYQIPLHILITSQLLVCGKGGSIKHMEGKLSLASFFPESLAGDQKSFWCWEDDREGTSKGVIAGGLVKSSMCLSGCFAQDNGCVVNGSIAMVGEHLLSCVHVVLWLTLHMSVCVLVHVYVSAVPLAVSHMYVCLLV